jgi:hypothetical protein
MQRIVILSLALTLTLSGCVVVGAPPGQAKKAAGVQSAAELRGDGVKVKVKAK